VPEPSQCRSSNLRVQRTLRTVATAASFVVIAVCGDMTTWGGMARVMSVFTGAAQTSAIAVRPLCPGWLGRAVATQGRPNSRRRRSSSSIAASRSWRCWVADDGAGGDSRAGDQLDSSPVRALRRDARL
jgi:hypothetical protein